MSPKRTLAWAVSSLALVTSSLALVAGPVAPTGAATTRATSHAFTGTNPQGKFLGVVPSLPQAAAPSARALRPAGSSQVAYHGGPVQHSSNVYAIFWKPNAYTLPVGYKDLVARYFSDVAHDSFDVSNTFSTDTQYFEGAGKTKRFVSYSVGFKVASIDAHKYPKAGCPNYVLDDGSTSTTCLTAKQIEKELVSVISAKKLPTGLGTEYFVLFPQGVASCFTANSLTTTGCYDPLTYSGYCAYHSHIGTAAHAVLYANLPYNALQGCDSGQSPNGNPADAVINNASHEQNETFTDPLGTGWYDISGNEIADKCHLTFGNPIWLTQYGEYNQVINNHGYWMQQIWSNRAKSCVPRNTYPQPTGSFTFKPAAPKRGQPVVFTAKGHDSDDTAFTYLWIFPKGVTSTGATTKFTFAGAGKANVNLVVFDAEGDQVRVTKTIRVS